MHEKNLKYPNKNVKYVYCIHIIIPSNLFNVKYLLIIYKTINVFKKIYFFNICIVVSKKHLS